MPSVSLKTILSQSSDLLNGQINYYLKMYTFDLSLNLPYITGTDWVGRKDVLYLTMHSTHFMYGYIASDMVKDHSDSNKGNLLQLHGLLFPVSSKGSVLVHVLCYSSRGALAGTRIAQWVYHEGSIRRPIAP